MTSAQKAAFLASQRQRRRKSGGDAATTASRRRKAQMEMTSVVSEDGNKMTDKKSGA